MPKDYISSLIQRGSHGFVFQFFNSFSSLLDEVGSMMLLVTDHKPPSSNTAVYFLFRNSDGWWLKRYRDAKNHTSSHTDSFNHIKAFSFSFLFRPSSKSINDIVISIAMENNERQRKRRSTFFAGRKKSFYRLVHPSFLCWSYMRRESKYLLIIFIFSIEIVCIFLQIARTEGGICWCVAREFRCRFWGGSQGLSRGWYRWSFRMVMSRVE